MSTLRHVAVTGLGVVSPVGSTIQDFWNSLLKGTSGVRRLKCFDASNFTSKIAAEVWDFDPSGILSSKEVRRMDPFVQFAVVAAKLAVADSGLDLNTIDRERIGVYVGSGIGGLHTIEKETMQYFKLGPEKGPGRISPFLIPMLIVNMASGQISITLGIKGPNSAVATACASGNHAIGDAFNVIRRGEADIMVAGGAEGAITPMGFGGFCAMRALSTRNDEPEKASRPFDKDRDGFIMGEGSGILILEEMEYAKKRGARIYCELAGYGMSGDAYHMTAPSPDGDGAARCMRASLKDAAINPEEVTYINAHGTSTLYNDKMETLAIKTVFGDHAKKLAISSTKSVTGHLLGAAGGVEAIVCAMAIKEGLIPPTINLDTPDPDCDLDYVPKEPRPMKTNVAVSNSLGFGGHNASLVFRQVT
ncbi:MAG: beta-ketoacyl-ACP synthase II [Candidatus Omnitrophota bacterium]